MEHLFNQTLEYSRVLGQPVDPRKPYVDLVSAICETELVDGKDYTYYYDVLQESDVVHTITSNGILTSVAVTPDTPTAFTFVDVASPEYYVPITALAKSKEDTLARKRRTIERALNAKEIQYVVSLMAAACASSGNQVTLGSGVTTFNISHLAEMVTSLNDYGDGFVLACSSQVYQDIILWNWNDDKNIDIFATFKKLNIRLMRLPNQSYTLDGASTDIITSTKAYLVATSSNSSIGENPLIFVRKRLDDINLLGGAILKDGEKPQRLILVSPMPMNVGGTNRYAGVGLTGIEEIVAAYTNKYAISEFTRS